MFFNINYNNKTLQIEDGGGFIHCAYVGLKKKKKSC